MPELRWILLVLGALLIGGLWWWEIRRSKQGPPAVLAETDPDSRGSERQEPRFDDAVEATPVEVPSMRAVEDRAIPRGDPPVVTLDDLPEDADQVVLAREPVVPTRRMEPVIARRDPPVVGADSWPDEEVVPDLDEVRPAPRTANVAGRREPSLDASPAMASSAPPRVTEAGAPPLLETASIATSRGAGAPARVAAAPTAAVPAAPRVQAAGSAPVAGATATRPSADSPPAASIGAAAQQSPGAEARRPAPRPSVPRASFPEQPKPPAEPPSTHQRIVAIRLVGRDGARFEGAALRAALEAESLRFGKYSIFHRMRPDGRAVFSVASLVEPGSFDVDRMGLHDFPGVSLFAVFPGPAEAPEGFDELLVCARRLADRLSGVLQDERGGPLSAQRVLGIREELVAFQGLVTRMRSRPAG